MTPAELETFYTKSIEDRTAEILKPLGLTDAEKSNMVHDILICALPRAAIRATR